MIIEAIMLIKEDITLLFEIHIKSIIMQHYLKCRQNSLPLITFSKMSENAHNFRAWNTNNMQSYIIFENKTLFHYWQQL